MTANTPNPIDIPFYAMYVLGISVVMWSVVYLGLLDIIRPNSALADDADDHYVDVVSNYILLDDFAHISMSTCFIFGLLPGALASIVLWSFIEYYLFVYAHGRQVTSYFDMEISLSFTWCVYGTMWLVMVIFDIPTLPAWLLLIATFAWLFRLTLVEYKSMYCSVLYAWIVGCIIQNKQ